MPVPQPIAPVWGYHGTTKEAAKSICQKNFLLSEKNYLWLGSGLYFFQDAPNLAWAWADELVSRIRGKSAVVCEPAVICAQIVLEDCMDLLDSTWHEVLRLGREAVAKLYAAEDRKLPEQKEFVRGDVAGPHRLDYMVINTAIAEYNRRHSPPIRCVRGAFLEGDPLYETSHVFSQGHVAIAVRDSSVITQVFEISRPVEKG
jgi:hypothetical protein